MSSIIYRQFKPEEMREVYPVFVHSLHDLFLRLGEQEGMGDVENPDFIEARWQRASPFFMHLSETSTDNWLAEQNNKPVAYARSVVRDNVQQLTELFVLPTVQSAGIGGELLKRAFADGDYDNRIIISSPDPCALPAYLKQNVYPHFSVYGFSRKPELVDYETDLSTEAITNNKEHIEQLNRLDRRIIGYERGIDHLYLMGDVERKGYLFIRKRDVVGYGYIGKRNGPFALEQAEDFPAVLAFAESDSARNERELFELEVPIINQQAVKHLLDRKFRIDMAFFEQFMLARPMGQFENYIITSLPLIT